MGRPSASTAGQEIQFAAIAAAEVSMNPSPPSEIGQRSKIASGSRRLIPSAIAFAASIADSDPLNLSGAMRNRLGMGSRF